MAIPGPCRLPVAFSSALSALIKRMIAAGGSSNLRICGSRATQAETQAGVDAAARSEVITSTSELMRRLGG